MIWEQIFTKSDLYLFIYIFYFKYIDYAELANHLQGRKIDKVFFHLLIPTTKKKKLLFTRYKHLVYYVNNAWKLMNPAWKPINDTWQLWLSLLHGNVLILLELLIIIPNESKHLPSFLTQFPTPFPAISAGKRDGKLSEEMRYFVFWNIPN